MVRSLLNPVEYLVKQLENENDKLIAEIKQIKNKFDDRECELMFENERLRLENNDYILGKSRFQQSRSENESRLKTIEVDLKKANESNKELKIKLGHTETQSKFEIEELRREIEELRESNKANKQESEKFRDFFQERSKTYAQKEYPDYDKKSQTSYENQRKRVNDLLNYKNGKEGEGDYTKSTADRVKSNWSIPEEDDEYSCVSQTPSRAACQPSSEEAFLRSSQRKYSKNYTVPQDKNSDSSNKSKLSNENDRNVYAGFKENENAMGFSKDIEYTEKQQKLMKSIERRVGGKHIHLSLGYEPVFCKLDTNQSENPTYKTPQVKFRNFVDPKNDEKSEPEHKQTN